MTTTSCWIVCPVCNGEGSTVNPNIDAQGLTHEDFYGPDADEDFLEAYCSGVFNIPCRACKGRTTIKQSQMELLEEAAEDRRLAALEDGDYESYLVAGDYRYGY